jgi:two-component system chemotaxis sensor kinase CheA
VEEIPESARNIGTPALSAAPGTQETVRVAVGKLDSLLAQAGELAVTQIRIDERLAQLQALQNEVQAWRREWRMYRGKLAALKREMGPAGLDGHAESLRTLLSLTETTDRRIQSVLDGLTSTASAFRDDSAALQTVTSSIEDSVMSVRLVPVGSAFGPLERMARDLSREHGKQIQLQFDGADTEIDRKILEQLRDPLMHMLRNAIDHGIEDPATRRARGKPAYGHITLAVAQVGASVVIEMRDDGRGLDADAIRASAVRKGILDEEAASALGDREALELIFHPGFSTRESITETSGRGVGMDVVRQNVDRLGGHIGMETVPGGGTRFTLSVPLTLATTRAVLVQQGDTVFALPSLMIERNWRVRARDVALVDGRRVASVDGAPVVMVELGEVLEGVSGPEDRWSDDEARPYIVIGQRDRRVGILCDRLLGEQEIVVKPLGWPLRRVRNVSGAAILGHGQLAIILNPVDLLKSSLDTAAHTRTQRLTDVGPGAAVRRARRVLIADDSLTTRTLERSIFESAGYETVAVPDGAQALAALRQENFDLVVSDVNMPNVDGFTLTASIRSDERLRDLPVILVTSLSDPEDRERGVSAGADAYVVKSRFDQGELLDTVGRLLA